jgi:SAM-dependent methyltransferase
MPYHVETYWSRVADEIRGRGPGNYVAGDDDPYHRYKRAKFLKRFLSTLDVTGLRVLELGCGPGGNLLELVRRAPTALTGVDISASMLALAAQALAQAGIPVELKKTDGQRLPLEDRSVDLAFTVTVLQHNVDPAMFSRMVEELGRVTAGRIVSIEDTGTSVSPAEGDTFIVRPIEAYRVEFGRHGFRLASATCLNLRFSRRVRDQLWRLLFPSGHREGQRLGFFPRTVLRSALGVTRHLDDLAPETRDLTKMVFVRGE